MVDELIMKLDSFRVVRARKQDCSHVIEIEAVLTSPLSAGFAQPNTDSCPVTSGDDGVIALTRRKDDLKLLSKQLRDHTHGAGCDRCNQINIATRECKLPVLLASDNAVAHGVDRLLNRMLQLIKMVPGDGDDCPEECRSCRGVRAELAMFVVPELDAVVAKVNHEAYVDAHDSLLLASGGRLDTLFNRQRVVRSQREW